MAIKISFLTHDSYFKSDQGDQQGDLQWKIEKKKKKKVQVGFFIFRFLGLVFWCQPWFYTGSPGKEARRKGGQEKQSGQTVITKHPAKLDYLQKQS